MMCNVLVSWYLGIELKETDRSALILIFESFFLLLTWFGKPLWYISNVGYLAKQKLYIKISRPSTWICKDKEKI